MRRKAQRAMLAAASTSGTMNRVFHYNYHYIVYFSEVQKNA